MSDAVADTSPVCRDREPCHYLSSFFAFTLACHCCSPPPPLSPICITIACLTNAASTPLATSCLNKSMLLPSVLPFLCDGDGKKKGQKWEGEWKRPEWEQVKENRRAGVSRGAWKRSRVSGREVQRGVGGNRLTSEHVQFVISSLILQLYSHLYHVPLLIFLNAKQNSLKLPGFCATELKLRAGISISTNRPFQPPPTAAVKVHEAAIPAQRAAIQGTEVVEWNLPKLDSSSLHKCLCKDTIGSKSWPPIEQCMHIRGVYMHSQFRF